MRVLALVVLAACSHPTNSIDAATGALNLDDCPTSIAPDFPAPYAGMLRCVTATVTTNSLVIVTPALPPHPTYYYGPGSPNYEPWDTRGGAYEPNPNTLVGGVVTFTIPLAPVPRNITITPSLVDGIVDDPVDEYHGGPAGVALDSVILYDGLAAPGDDLSTEVYTFDEWRGHPAPNGQYHYHGNALGPLAVLERAGLSNVDAYGLMCDGTFVLGCTELDGSAPDQTDLDAQNGHVHDIVDDFGVTLTARYHVHICPLWTDHPRPYTPEIQYYDTCNAL